MIVIHKDVAKWVMQPLGKYNNDMQAIGQWDGDKLIAGVAFESQNKNCIVGHQRITSTPSREFWITVANYIFIQCGCKKFSAIVDVDNLKAIELNKHIGFVIEATLKDSGENGDVHVMTLWKDKCSMLNWKLKK